ncbi:endonuclease [Clostridium sporogenes]|uniref:endonuclease n=1 Tax=Clostridium sporogenes TaxID=1509 RepID=UPI0013D65678|nr:endonuclease [Clostridium sporogenes]NFF69431.1 endonuclease [Clostridium sporogenes]NFF77526.1 endonuclease [Clostridium sporogenes]NFG00700.1 endonuclease [Clostridium sporogenes]NFG08271.1 endonuclease [Clostridium sporogenes]NFG53401.1 endonuclease [Clostridium sporogenes]
MLFKLCPYCGIKVPYDMEDCINKCKEKRNKLRNKEYDLYNRDKESTKIYRDKRWLKLTGQCKNKFDGLDIYQLYKHNKIVYGDLSHHIIEVKEDKKRVFDISNLIYVSNKSHAEIHTAYKKSKEDKLAMQAYLFKIVQRYKEEYK